MAFKHLQIRYQTPRSLPAPYAYFYTLTARPTASGLVDVSIAITFPDREGIDEDEMIAEGFSADDDFSWSGRLPNAWQRALTELTDKTRLNPLDEDSLGEDDPFLELTLTLPNGQQQHGTPRHADEWTYLVQELMQATYEAGEREAPFELHFLDRNSPDNVLEINLRASFAERAVQVERIQGRTERRKTLPWSTLQPLMTRIYDYDFSTDEPLTKRPKQGQWLNLGTDEWYDLSQRQALVTQLRSL